MMLKTKPARHLVIGCISFVLFGCVAQNIQPISTKHYELLFSKTVSTGNGMACMKVFHSEELLYFLTVSENVPLSKVHIYDSRTSLFAEVVLRIKRNDKCDDIELNSVRTQQFAKFNYIESKAFKHLFDNAAQNPDALNEAINAGPIYFRHDGKYQDERSAMNLLKPSMRNVRSLDDVSDYLKNISVEKAQSYIGPRAYELLRVDAEQMARNERRVQARRRWDNRLSVSLNTGDKVCTYKNNYFGYVETKSNSKVKVHVVGQANSISNSDGYFFKGYGGQFLYDKMESMRWFERDELAPCSFD